MKITEYPVVSGYADPPKTSEAVFPLLDEASQKLVVALRVVCGGSAVTTRSLFAQADGEFPFAPGPAAMLNRFDSADNDRPTILHIDSIDILRSVYGALALPHVVADRSLQVAIRRLVYAGVRATDTDRLVDLMTAAEALFIKRANLIGATKGDKIATGAEAMLARDPQFDSGGPLLHAFMTMAYRARNAEIHGDGKPYKSLHMLSGQPTTSLADVVGDAESIMRRAIMTVLTLLTNLSIREDHAIRRLTELRSRSAVGGRLPKTSPSTSAMSSLRSRPTAPAGASNPQRSRGQNPTKLTRIRCG